MEQLDFIVNGGETRRYHTWPVIRQQRVDEHSFHVAMLVSIIAQGADPACGVGLSVPLLMAALTHDLAEHKTGDLPAPAKRNPAVVNREAWNAMEAGLLAEQGLDWETMLSDREKRWLKLADAMQGCLYCIRERMMGNRLIETVYNNFRGYVGQLDQDEDALDEIIDYIDDMWEQANGNS